MKTMLPPAVFVSVAAMGQIITVAIALGIEQAGVQWASVTTFGGLYLVMFPAAWKVTVLIVDGVLARKGLLEV